MTEKQQHRPSLPTTDNVNGLASEGIHEPPVKNTSYTVDHELHQGRPTKQRKLSWKRGQSRDLPKTDVPDLRTVNVGDYLDTSVLSNLFDDYDGMPAQIYVRKEMTMAWDLLFANYVTKSKGVGNTAGAALYQAKANSVFCKVLNEASMSQAEAAAAQEAARQAPSRVLLIGSPGVGKSVVALVFCAYLAAYHDYDILYIRALSTYPYTLIVHFSGCHVIKDPEFSAKAQSVCPFQDKFKSECLIAGKKHLVAGDGSLYGCDLLAVSSIPKHYLHTSFVLVLLPAWTKTALKAAVAASSTLTESFGERYAVSGGSVSRFLIEPQQLRDSLVNDFDRLYWFRQTLKFIKDTEMYEQYVSLKHSHTINDATFVLRHVLSEGSIHNFASTVEWAATTPNASLYAMQFTALVTKLAFDQVLKLLISQDGSQQLLVDASCAVVSGHATSAACLAYLQHDLPPGTYWYPGCDDFPAINDIFVKDGWINYIQTTVLPDHVVAWGELAIVQASVKRNTKLQNHKYRLVLVMPVKVTWVGLEFAPEIDEFVVCTGEEPELLVDASCAVVSSHATSAACLAYLQHDLPPGTYCPTMWLRGAS
ncbi:hypothetical protein SDRG_17136 [Saprolegnia diclina VS20]|uniref:Crinkler (CRN) family protein n=1 Tax=Saprolegnia diclina (strain VS20) TaxID=1156394 RepID=T0QZ26_SAPDV|nr:hypothetical protein SDRG_17136 [Saprolegnia diclina VS20]EQC24988.1 hypothetical protein SDRG_17136 [Saprolegnia diclina VS20]|eukprot:XP_008621593.1 hypothetical protein SDRG_17136 [Saprolegnia diclina VS20]